MIQTEYSLQVSPQLSRDEEHRCLCRALYYNDDKARELLVTSNYAYAVFRTTKICPGATQSIRDSLISNALIGLVESINRFDLNLLPDVRLRSYATHWIDRYVLDGLTELSSGSLPRLPTNVRRLLKIYDDQRCAVQQATSGSVSSVDLFADPEMSSYADVLPLYIDPVSISFDAPSSDSTSTGFLHEIIPGDNLDANNLLNNLDRSTAVLSIKNRLAFLRPSVKSIVLLSFGFDGEPVTLQSIANDLNVSREYVRQLRAKALRYLGKMTMNKRQNSSGVNENLNPYKALSAAVMRTAFQDMLKAKKKINKCAITKKPLSVREENDYAIAKEVYAECRKFLLSLSSPYHIMLDLEPEMYKNIVDRADHDARLHN